MYYDWFESGWCPDDDSVKELENFINDHVSRVKILKYEAVVPELVDEHWHVRNLIKFYSKWPVWAVVTASAVL